MAELFLNNDKYILPESWDELTELQLLRIADLSMLNLSPYEFRLYLLVAILDFTVPQEMAYSVNNERCYRMRSKKITYLISEVDLAYTCINSLGFLFTERNVGDDVVLDIDCKLSKSLITSIKVNGEDWIAPGDALNNIIYEEYIRALISASEFTNTHNPSDLHKLIATLYRPAKNDGSANTGDMRIPFNDFAVEENAKKLNKLPEYVKIAILLQFNGALYSIAQTFKDAFKKGSGKASAKNIFLQQLDIVDNLAYHKIPEKEQIRKTQLYDVLHTLNNLITINT